MPGQSTLRTEEDLQRVIRALAREFNTDTVFIIGSQAILMSWPDPPSIMLMTPEIDAYPANARVWEIAEQARDDGIPREASEHAGSEKSAVSGCWPTNRICVIRWLHPARSFRSN
jgi:hypothetical protein